MTKPLQYDLIILGATGFVGGIVCRYLLSHWETATGENWAIAGRSQAKLDHLVQSLGPQAAHLTTFVVDVEDEAAVTALCSQTKVVVSTVGPYALYGETLVRVCATTGTDYCDLTGEVQWVQQMIQKYEAIAQQSGARIVHCCGFDSIPSDLGVYYLQRQSQQRWGEPCIRVKMRVKTVQGGISGGTIASGINLIQEAIADPATRQALRNPYILCFKPNNGSDHPPTLIPVQNDSFFDEWITPFVMAGINTPIVLRSNALQNGAYGESFQYDEGILTGPGIAGWLGAQGMKWTLDLMALALAIAPSRWLLTQVLPQPGEGPTEAEQQQGFYDLRFWGQTASGHSLMVKVTGDQDPGYGSTAKILAQAALCLAKDKPKSSLQGGFWTPASSFGQDLIQRLVDYAGLTFTEENGFK
ncbi:saccharopine dehydrogenase NADP-binding domain-containing protein [Synechocystis sp. LEGE 06083]|uniref:saccharopine dehydrogenase family protein n=1 Tax=Synechocystis sp. LEGE 06083 TaxID=915336 RepID=UPI001881E409|nr:trans-acting enoyl reductase family protein [Synechocystis sp. LEGE 06083]MBE9194672.1 saccharopine dehydrogenase NADP-binding domain-containing protein [Synechocystis sp. LEGE 06083]